MALRIANCGVRIGGRDFSCAALGLALLLSVACGGGSAPTSPSPVTSAAVTSVRVVSGWDQQPVAGAVAVAAGRSYITDSAGLIAFDRDARDVAIDIEAPGFLPRQTRVLPVPISLWPAADAAAADAIGRLVFDGPTRESLAAAAFSMELAVDEFDQPFTTGLLEAGRHLNQLFREVRVGLPAGPAASTGSSRQPRPTGVGVSRQRQRNLTMNA